mgnify:FL=1
MSFADENLRFICREVLRRVPFTTSVILHGSRATGEIKGDDDRDYDVFVVLKTPLFLFYVKRMKGIEAEARKRGFKLDISVLPTFRLKYGRGDLSAYFIKATGVTLLGRDYLTNCDLGHLGETIDRSWIQYCVYVMRRLMWGYDPSTGRFDADGILKALIVCCRLIVLFVTGEYVVKPENMLRIIQPYRVSGRLAFGGEALNLLEETLGGRSWDESSLFFSVRDIAMNTYASLIRMFFGIKDKDLRALTSKYLRATRRRAFIENLIYASSLFTIRREVIPGFNPFGPSVFDKFNMATAWLLMSLREDGSIDSESIHETYRLLSDCINLSPSRDNVKLWLTLRDVIRRYYHYARTGFQFSHCIYTAFSSIIGSSSRKRRKLKTVKRYRLQSGILPYENNDQEWRIPQTQIAYHSAKMKHPHSNYND